VLAHAEPVVHVGHAQDRVAGHEFLLAEPAEELEHAYHNLREFDDPEVGQELDYTVPVFAVSQGVPLGLELHVCVATFLTVGQFEFLQPLFLGSLLVHFELLKIRRFVVSNLCDDFI